MERPTIEAAFDPAVTHAGRLVQDSHLHRAARPGGENIKLSDNYQKGWVNANLFDIYDIYYYYFIPILPTM